MNHCRQCTHILASTWPPANGLLPVWYSFANEIQDGDNGELQMVSNHWYIRRRKWKMYVQWNLSTQLAPSGLSCTQWNLSTVDTIGAQLAVLYTVEPLYRGHHWDQLAVLYREVSLIQRLICTQFYVVGTADRVLLRKVPFYSECRS